MGQTSLGVPRRTENVDEGFFYCFPTAVAGNNTLCIYPFLARSGGCSSQT